MIQHLLRDLDIVPFAFLFSWFVAKPLLVRPPAGDLKGTSSHRSVIAKRCFYILCYKLVRWLVFLDQTW